MRTLRIPFAVDGRGFFAWTDNDADIVEQQILDFMLTNYGERVGNPGYGANLRTMLFVNMDVGRLNIDRDKIAANLSAQLSIATIQSVSFAEEGPGTMRVTVVYRLIPQQETRTFTFVLNGLVTEETAP